MGGKKFSSRISRREICSRKYVLNRNSGNRELFKFSICPSVHLSISPSVRQSICPCVRPSVRPFLSFLSFLSFLFFRFFLFFSFFFLFSSRISLIFRNSFIFSSSPNSRRDRELFLVPKNTCREVFGNCFYKIFGNWRDMTEKLWCLI
jgi:hypothetical protein